MEQILKTINNVVWGIPALILILGVGIYYSFSTNFSQLRFLPAAFQKLFKGFKDSSKNKDGTTGYQALCTALAATAGTGNIAGVAGAIALGGPGVVFWMWFSGALGMITKFAEVTLAVHYRHEVSDGKYIGGPMYIIEHGLPRKFRFLAYLYCYLGAIAAFGVGNATQINALLDSTRNASQVFRHPIGIIGTGIISLAIAMLVLLCFWKDNGRIGIWAEKLIPFGALIYIVLAIGVLSLRFDRLGDALGEILLGAFHPNAVTCGVISSWYLSLRVGASRGVFTNEAGMGTASIAHASAQEAIAVEQGLMGIMEVFLDTILLCTLTALVILCSDVQIVYGTDPGITLAMDAFASVYGQWSRGVISMLICLFAFATILGWGLYGIRCMQYLFGSNIWRIYSIAHVLCILVNSMLNTSLIWTLSELMNGLMAIPNLIALIFLSPKLIYLVRIYSQNRKAYNTK